MIDPHNITDFNRSDADLELLILFSVSVAGKKATQISAKIDRFLWVARSRCAKYLCREMKTPKRVVDWSPFKLIRFLTHIAGFSQNDEVTACLKRVKLGKYTVLKSAFITLAHSKVNLHTCPLAQLETVKGISFKTSRYFALHSRKDQQIAVLDTHVLHFLRDQGVKAPRNTPSSMKTYARLEAKMLEFAKASGKPMADFDLEIWRRYTKTKPMVASS
jgi:thermostable 8-oxoguanine DNA glycosylase